MRALIGTLVLVPALAVAAPGAPYDKSAVADWAVAPTPGPEPTFRPPVAKRLVLANGMTVLVVENHALPIVAMSLVVAHAGAAQDPRGKAGLAAFTADLLDEGAGGLSALALAQEQDRLGASITIGVTPDAAFVSVSTLTKTLEPTLDLLGKVLTRPAFEAHELDRVKGDRATGLALLSDRPVEVVQIVLTAALFGAGTPYGHSPSGERADFATLAGPDVHAFYAAHWTPAAMSLVIAGDVDPVALRAKLDAGLGAWTAAAPAPATLVTTPAKLGTRLALVDRPGAAQSDVRIGLVGPGRRDARYYAFEVMTTTLGRGFTSRLLHRLREELGITYVIGADADWRVDGGSVFGIATAIESKATGTGVGEILKIVDGLGAADLTPAELDAAKQHLIRQLPAQFATNAGVARAYAQLALYGLADDWYARYADNVRKVTARDVRAAAKLVPASKLVVAVVGDLAKIRPDLDKLGLGDPELHDVFGLPVK